MVRERSKAPNPKDFKIEAVRLYREIGKSLEEVAEDLGVSTNSLQERTERHDVEAGTRSGLKQDEQEELERLRIENKILPSLGPSMLEQGCVQMPRL
jgi:transposase-like protein